jgi:predicted dehydrogenase
MTTTKVALLSFAHTHALAYTRALVARDDVELLTADPDGRDTPDQGPRGHALARDLGAAYVDGYDEALAWRPDAVIVTAENSRHRALVERAARAGAHILCEKPLATSVSDADAMLSVVADAGINLMMAYPVRFSSAFAELRRQVRSGALGSVIGIRGTNNGKVPQADRAWFTDRDQAGGGALVDHVVHCAQLIDELLGEQAGSVRAVTNRIVHAEGGIAVETGGLVTARYPSGVVATIDCSWSEPETSPTWGGLTLEVTGTRGRATARPFAQHVAGFDAAGAVWVPVGDDLDAAMIDDFLQCVRGRHTPVADGRVGYRTLQIVDAARRSAGDGRPVPVR